MHISSDSAVSIMLENEARNLLSLVFINVRKSMSTAVALAVGRLDEPRVAGLGQPPPNGNGTGPEQGEELQQGPQVRSGEADESVEPSRRSPRPGVELLHRQVVGQRSGPKARVGH